MPARGKKVSEKQESCRGIEGLDHRWVPGEISGAMYCSKCGVAKDLADAKERLAELFGIARPAEAEGAVQCPASHPAECYAPGTQVVHANLVHGIVRQADALSATLSAVTAEAERLQAECLALLSERDQLRAEVERLTAQGEDEAVLGDHNLIPSLQAEVEALRKDAERYRELRAALFVLYGDKHVTWHSLHIAMDDGNMRDSDVAFCAREAEKRGDLLGLALAYLLLEVPESERDAMPSDVELGRTWLEARDGDIVVTEAIDGAMAAKEGV